MPTLVLKVKLPLLNRTKAQRLEALRDQFTACVQFHLQHILILKTTDPTVVHHACYHEARRRFSLPASTIQQARDKAIAAYRSYLQRKKKDRRTKPPTFRRAIPLRLAVENLRVYPERGMIRISTPQGFLWLPILIPSCFAHRIGLDHAVSELVRHGKHWYLMLAVKVEDVPDPDGERPHFGLDLGLANLAVLAGPGTVKFFDGKPLRYVRGRYFRYRQALQQKRKVGMIKRSKGKESRWVASENHRISRAIVNLVAQAGGILHVECLTGIRERCRGTGKVRRLLHAWPFAQLLGFIRYKAALAGVKVVEEDPRHTSQRCSRCGHTARGNRPVQALFRCQGCGYELHADLNAAWNLAAKGAYSLGVGGVTPPGRIDAESGESMVVRKGRHRGNRDLASSM
jgi:IS605 OrfB family transposase